MRACLVFSALLTAASWIAQVEAAACAEICYTTELTGFAPGGVPGCTCSGSAAGARTGAGGCNCGQCYEKAQGLIIGFAINTDGTCTYGTDCGNCELESSSSSNASTNATATPTAVPATSGSSSSSSTLDDTSIDASASVDSPASASSYSSNSNSVSGSSNSNSNDKTGDNTGSESGSNSKDKGLSLWQIVLAICCSVLIFVVAVVSVFACYCKARNRLYEHEENHATYYNQHTQRTPTYQPWAGNGIAPPVASTSKSNIV